MSANKNVCTLPASIFFLRARVLNRNNKKIFTTLLLDFESRMANSKKKKKRKTITFYVHIYMFFFLHKKKI